MNLKSEGDIEGDIRRRQIISEGDIEGDKGDIGFPINIQKRKSMATSWRHHGDIDGDILKIIIFAKKDGDIHGDNGDIGFPINILKRKSMATSWRHRWRHS